jgi:hypothetical protein
VANSWKCTVLPDFFFFLVRGPRSWCYGRTAALRLIVQLLWWRWRWGWAVFYQVLQVMEHQWNEIDRGKPTARRKTCPSATLSTTNLTWTWPGIEPGPPWWDHVELGFYSSSCHLTTYWIKLENLGKIVLVFLVNKQENCFNKKVHKSFGNLGASSKIQAPEGDVKRVP